MAVFAAVTRPRHKQKDAEKMKKRYRPLVLAKAETQLGPCNVGAISLDSRFSGNERQRA
jgi:hypothetical protein